MAGVAVFAMFSAAVFFCTLDTAVEVTPGEGICVLDKRGGGARPFEAVRDAVAEEWRRRQAESALEHYLQGLRRAAKIRYADDAPTAEAKP